MELRFHRSRGEGCPTTVEFKSRTGARVFIDLGSGGKPDKDERDFPVDVPGLTLAAPGGARVGSALFISHLHRDHSGRLDEALSSVDLRCGKGTLALMLAMNRFMLSNQRKPGVAGGTKGGGGGAEGPASGATGGEGGADGVTPSSRRVGAEGTGKAGAGGKPRSRGKPGNGNGNGNWNAEGRDSLASLQRRQEALERVVPFGAGVRGYPCGGVGGLVVTPVPTDHSCPDCYMFAVEEGRTKVLVTGDFRCHGLGWAKAASGLKGAARGARWLVCLPAFEWLGGGGEEANPFTPEEEVGERASRIIRDSPLAFAVCNPSNLDRISGLLKASRRSGAGRLFIVDSYQMAIMDAAREFRDPSGGARYSFKGALRLTGRESEADFALWKEHGFLMLVRESCFFRRYLERFLGMPGGAGVGHGATITGEALEEGGGSGSGGEDGAVILYSQWRGFREGGRGGERGVAGLLAGWKGRTILVSTGGHASPGDLARLAADFCPKARIVPVDCGCSEGIKKAFPEKDKVVDLEPGRYLALD